MYELPANLIAHIQTLSLSLSFLACAHSFSQTENVSCSHTIWYDFWKLLSHKKFAHAILSLYVCVCLNEMWVFKTHLNKWTGEPFTCKSSSDDVWSSNFGMLLCVALLWRGNEAYTICENHTKIYHYYRFIMAATTTIVRIAYMN